MKKAKVRPLKLNYFHFFVYIPNPLGHPLTNLNALKEWLGESPLEELGTLSKYQDLRSLQQMGEPH